MDVQELLKKLVLLILEGIGKEAAVEMVMNLYDEHVAPIDLPGPDAILDPAIRGVLAVAVPLLYDAMIDSLRNAKE